MLKTWLFTAFTPNSEEITIKRVIHKRFIAWEIKEKMFGRQGFAVTAQQHSSKNDCFITDYRKHLQLAAHKWFVAAFFQKYQKDTVRITQNPLSWEDKSEWKEIRTRWYFTVSQTN